MPQFLMTVSANFQFRVYNVAESFAVNLLMSANRDFFYKCMINYSIMELHVSKTGINLFLIPIIFIGLYN
jgi:hypothetical protein